jgi:hypothetical protein
VWDPNLIWQYVYLVSDYGEGQEIAYELTPQGDGVMELTPRVKLSSGVYCLIQTDSLGVSFFFPNWCIKIRSISENLYPDQTRKVLNPTETLQPPTQEIAITNIIRIWKIGSPHRGDIPDDVIPNDIVSAAAGLGYGLKVEVYPARGFAQVFFDALIDNTEPDILYFDNYGILRGITTELGTFEGIYSDESVKERLIFVSGTFESFGRGWQVLISTSKNFDAVRQLALLESQCPSDWVKIRIPPESDVPKIKEMALISSAAYLEGNISALQEVADDMRLPTTARFEESTTVLDINVCQMWGNQNFVIVGLVASFQNEKRLGHIEIMNILRRDNSDWRLLVVSTDPVSLNALDEGYFGGEGVPKFSSLLTLEDSNTLPPKSASLIAPNDGVFPDLRSGVFEWQPSKSKTIIAEFVEFEYGYDTRLFPRLRSSQIYSTNSIPADSLWSTQDIWHWRVWSISENGILAFSDVRSFFH